VVCDSDEHDQAGHINEDLVIRIEQQEKRMRKQRGLIEELIEPVVYGPDDAKTVFVCWGSSSGPVRESVDIMNNEGSSAAMLHFCQVWPLDIEQIGPKFEAFQRVIVVEGNYSGQFASLLQREGCTKPIERINRYDGLPLTADFILGEVKNDRTKASR